MLYENVAALAQAALQLDPRDTKSMRKLQELIRVYFDALYNPPEGVIGVGAITYAEKILMDYQLNKKGVK